MVVCSFCDYSWKGRVENPKECPRCKRRLDYPGICDKIVDIRQILEEA